MSGKLLLKNEHLATISEKDEEEKKIVEKPELRKNLINTTIFHGTIWKKFIRKASLMLIVFCYTAFGAMIFQILEYEEDIVHIQEVKDELESNRLSFLRIVKRSFNFNESLLLGEESEPIIDKDDYIENALIAYENQLESSIKDGVSASLLNFSHIEPRWTYIQSVFFAATVLTTIDEKFLWNLSKWCIPDDNTIISCRLNEVKSLFRDTGRNLPLGYGNIAPGTDMGRIFCIAFALIGIPLTLSMIADMGEVLASCLPIETFRKILPKGRWRTILSVVGIFSLLLLFIAIGGVLFLCLEDWSFLDAFYFCFITTTTIGFGDLVPTTSSLLVCGVYILVGLALTSTVIEIVRRQYAASFDKMKQLTMRIHQLSIPLAEAMRRMAETGSGEMELDTKLVRELQELNTALTEVQKEEDDVEIAQEFQNDPWQALLDMAEKKKRITVLMYESSV